MCAVTKVANASGLVKRKENKTGPFKEFHVIVLESNLRKQPTFRISVQTVYNFRTNV